MLARGQRCHCHRRPGVDVIDVDVRGAGSGWAALNRLRQAGLVDDGMPRVRTPSGGVHLYFLDTDQGNGSLHREHVDFRSSGGYVLVPPSRVATDSYAGVYRWERRAEPTTRMDWQAVRELLRPPTPVITAHRRGESPADPTTILPPQVWATAELLNQLLEAAARTSAIRTPAHPTGRTAG